MISVMLRAGRATFIMEKAMHIRGIILGMSRGQCICVHSLAHNIQVQKA